MPVAVALVSFAPLYAVFFQMLVNVAGLLVFARAYGEAVPWWVLARMPFSYLPYQWLLAFSALRATVRHLRGLAEWEKTEHVGAHRAALPARVRTDEPVASRNAAQEVLA